MGSCEKARAALAWRGGGGGNFSLMATAQRSNGFELCFDPTTTVNSLRSNLVWWRIAIEYFIVDGEERESSSFEPHIDLLT